VNLASSFEVEWEVITRVKKETPKPDPLSEKPKDQSKLYVMSVHLKWIGKVFIQIRNSLLPKADGLKRKSFILHSSHSAQACSQVCGGWSKLNGRNFSSCCFFDEKTAKNYTDERKKGNKTKVPQTI
jgi:hypothetical protein